MQTITTDANVSYTPTAPKPVDTPDTPAGTILKVGKNCDDPTTGLVARWTQANWGDIVEIDPEITPKCDGRYIFPAKAADNGTSHRYILTRVKGADENLGTRSVGPSDKSHMARFVHTGATIEMYGAADPMADPFCFAGHLRWRQHQGGTWQMHKCINDTPKAIASIPSSGNMNITVRSHGYPTNSLVHVAGVTGIGADAVNGDWYIAVVDSNTIQLRYHIGAIVQTATGPASGGTVQLNKFHLEPVTEGTALPAKCTWGNWWHKQAGAGSENEYQRTWYCSAENEWSQYRMDPNLNQGWPEIDLTVNKAHHLRFQGLSFEPLALKADPLREQYNYQVAHTPSGYLFPQFVTQSYYTHHIYWDQILAVCPDPSRTGVMVNCQAFANPFDGAHIKVSRSYFAGFQTMGTKVGMSDDSAVVFAMFVGPGPREFSDNYIACAGICVYFVDDTASTSFDGDLTFIRNTVETPDKYWNLSPSWIGREFDNNMYWSQRHRFESKRLVRGRIEGNVFKGGWAFNNNAAAICLCSRGGGTGALISSVAGDTITTHDANTTSTWVIPDLHTGDRVYIHSLGGGTCVAQPQQIYTVARVISATSVRLTPAPDCTATTGRIVRVFAHTNRNTDISVKNNTFEDSPIALVLISSDTTGDGGHGNPDWSAERISITNNIAQTDQRRIGLGSFYGNPSVAPTGHFVTILTGPGFLTLEHNTVYPRISAGGPAVFLNTDQYPGWGLRMRYNIAENEKNKPGISAYSFGNGTTALNAIFGTSWLYESNGWLRTGSPDRGYPSGSLWYNPARGVEGLFTNYTNFDYSLKPAWRRTDACYGVAGDCTTDGKDLGVDMDALRSAQSSGATGPRQGTIIRGTIH